MSLTTRIAFGVALVLAVAAAGSNFYMSRWAAPDCDSEEVLHRMGAALRDQDHLDSIFINNIRTLSGNWFSAARECSADVSSIRGDVAASSMPWREVLYQIAGNDESGKLSVAVTLGDTVPLAGPEESFWDRFLALF